MKILVTGGAGFIGSHIVEHYQGRAEEIRVLDNLRTGYRRNLDGLEHTYIEGSITDRELVKRAVEGVNLVFHMAAMVSVPESMSKPGECVDINVHGLLNVLEEASAAGVRKLVFASSAAVYGDNPVVPKLETMLPEPKSPYAITKLDGEYYLGMFEREGLLETAAIRFFNSSSLLISLPFLVFAGNAARHLNHNDLTLSLPSLPARPGVKTGPGPMRPDTGHQSET